MQPGSATADAVCGQPVSGKIRTDATERQSESGCRGAGGGEGQKCWVLELDDP